MNSYRVTEKAGRMVNGERVTVGQIVRMTATQAQFYLDQGEIEPAGPALPSPGQAGARKAKG